MRVAYLNRNPSTHPGGDLIMLNSLMCALRKIGVQCDEIYGEWTPARLRTYDIVTVYHINFDWSLANISKTILSGRPYVIVPIFYPTDKLGMNYEQMQKAMEASACVCPLSFAEAKEITSYTGYSGPFCVIPHGTDEKFHAPDDGEHNNYTRSIEREYVMTSCARGGKGEDLVEEVCTKMRIPYWHIEGLKHGSHEHIEAYRMAKVFVHSSPDDRMSLTVGEALCAGCRVISSIHDRGNEWFPKLKLADPLNEYSLAEAINWAWSAEEWDYTPNQQARKMSWLHTALAFKVVYERAMR